MTNAYGAAPAESRWYVQVEGRNEGPLPEGEVLARLRLGEFDEQTACALDGEPQWRLVGSHPAFAEVLLQRRSAVGDPPSEGPSAQRKLAIGCGVASLSTVAMCCVGMAVLAWPNSPPELEIVSTEIVQRPHEPGDRNSSTVRPTEVVQITYRADREVLVEVGGVDEGRSDADGEGVVELEILPGNADATIETTLTARESYHSDYPPTDVAVRVQRTHTLFPARNGFSCNYGPCRVRSGATSALDTEPPPEGSVTVGTRSSTAIDVTDDLLRAALPSQLFGPDAAAIPLPFVVTFADGTALRETLSVSGSDARQIVSARFRSSAGRPTPMPVEGTGGALLSFVGSTPRLLGRASRMGDIGRVAFGYRQPQRRQCGSYSNADAVRRLYVTRRHMEVRVFDRRTGARLESRLFRAPPIACPRTISVRPGSGDIHWSHSDVVADEMHRWVASYAASAGGQ